MSLDTARTIAERIYDRRNERNVQDPDLGKWPGVDDLLAVADYVHRYRHVPAEVYAADLLDVLTILRELDDETDRRRVTALKSARGQGIPWSRLAGPLGVGTPQGAQQYAQRLFEQANGGPRSEVAARRRREVDALERDQADRHVETLRGIAATLLSLREEIPDDLGQCGVDLDDLADLMVSGSPTSLAAAMRLIAGELSGWPLNTDVRAAIDRAHELLSQD